MSLHSDSLVLRQSNSIHKKGAIKCFFRFQGFKSEMNSHFMTESLKKADQPQNQSYPRLNTYTDNLVLSSLDIVMKSL